MNLGSSLCCEAEVKENLNRKLKIKLLMDYRMVGHSGLLGHHSVAKQEISKPY